LLGRHNSPIRPRDSVGQAGGKPIGASRIREV